MDEDTAERGEPPDRRAFYQAAMQLWIHGEEILWSVLYYFLVANSIVLLAWAGVFSAGIAPELTGMRFVVLWLLWLAGVLVSVFWLAYTIYSLEFRDVYRATLLNAEADLARQVGGPGPFTKIQDARRGKRRVRSALVLRAVPLVFLAVYLGLAMALVALTRWL